MATNKKYPDSLSYLAESRKKGFSYDEIRIKLKKAGYSEDEVSLSEMAYLHKRRSRLLISLLVIAVIAFIATSYVQHRALQNTTRMLLESAQAPQQGFIGPERAGDCIGKSGQEQAQCIAYAKEALQRAIMVAEGSVKTEIQAQLAAADNDPSRCDGLETQEKIRCKALMISIKADLSDDPDTCQTIPGLPDQVKCYMDVLARTDPAKAKQIRELIDDMKSSGDRTKCQQLEKEFLIQACMQT